MTERIGWESGAFLCGSARAEITPGSTDGLYGLMGIPFGGILDPLFVRVIAFSTGEKRALMVSFDLDKAPNPKTWIPLLAEQTGIPEENILYLATHTHSAPLTTVRPGERYSPPPENARAMAAYEETVKEKLLACVSRALRQMCPAKFGWSTGESFINVNRNDSFFHTSGEKPPQPYGNLGTNFSAETDHTVFVIRIEDLDENPIAFFVNYPVHCCTMFRNRYDRTGRMGISADIAGRISTWLEERYPGSTAIWSSGAAGDINPVMANEVFYPDPKDGSPREWLFPDAEAIYGIMNALAARHYADICQILRKIECTHEAATISGAVEWAEVPHAHRIRMQLLRLGDIRFLGIGGELYSAFGQKIRQRMPQGNMVIINHAASLIDDCGYLLDDQTLRLVRQQPSIGFIPGSRTDIPFGCVESALESGLQNLIHMESNIIPGGKL